MALLKICSVFIVATSLFCPARALSSEGDFALIHGPYLSDLGETAAVINWSTSQEAAAAVELQGDDGVWRSQMATRDGLFVTGSMHSVVISGLRPGQHYSYRVTAKPIREFGSNSVHYGPAVTSDTYAFDTLSRERQGFFRAFIFNDLHGDINKLRTMFQHVDLQPGDIVFFNGDMVDNLVDDHVLNSLIDFCVESFATKYPLYYVRGNHETRGRYALAFSQRFPSLAGRTFHTVTQGPAEFIILDSGEDKEDEHPEYSGLANFDYFRSQIETPWLRDLATKRQDPAPLYRLAVFHMPIFGGIRWHGERQISQLWQPLLNQAGIDLEISGHTHVRLWVPQDYVLRHFPIMIGGIKSFIKLTVDRKEMKLEVIGLSGERLDQHNFRPKR